MMLQSLVQWAPEYVEEMITENINRAREPDGIRGRVCLDDDTLLVLDRVAEPA
jgi:hypothetical protein